MFLKSNSTFMSIGVKIICNLILFKGIQIILICINLGLLFSFLMYCIHYFGDEPNCFPVSHQYPIR